MLKLLATLVAGFLVGSFVTLGVMATVLGSSEPAIAAVPAKRRSGDVTISVSRDYLTSQVAESVRDSGLPVPLKDVKVELEPDAVLAVSARTDTPVVSLRSTASFKIYAADGRLLARPLDVHLGGLPIDRLADDAIAAQVNARLSTLTDNSAVSVLGVSTTSDGLAITALLRPS